MPRRTPILIALLALALVAIALGHLCTGDVLGGLHWPESPDVLAIRLRRLLIAGIVGGSLALAGVLLQAMLRNPLASPDLLGVTAGAGLGVSVMAYLAAPLAGAAVGAAAVATQSAPTPLASFAATPLAQTLGAGIGAAVTLKLVLAWTTRRGGIDVVSLVLVGVIVGMTCGGLTLLLHHLLPDRGVNARAWFFGSVNESTPTGLLVLAGLVLAACLAMSLHLGRSIDAACLAEDEARSVGVRLGRLRFLLFSASGLLATFAVLLAGPIGFVGLIVPHAIRMILGPHHRPLVLAATIAGAAVLIAADGAVSALPLSRGGRLPVGVVMAIVGGPCFLILLRSTLRRNVLG